MTNAQRPLEIRMKAVGTWPMNSYAFVCPLTHHSVLIDPGADPTSVMELLDGTTPQAILLTHTHADHLGALNDMRQRLGVPLLAHPGPHVDELVLDTDRLLGDGDVVLVGEGQLHAYATPGHTGDMVCFADTAGNAIVVGDTLFAGGPGKTWSPDGFRTTLHTLRDVVLRWPDNAVCYPGHGPAFRLGDLRPAITAFIAHDHEDFFGDATWDT